MSTHLSGPLCNSFSFDQRQPVVLPTHATRKKFACTTHWPSKLCTCLFTSPTPSLPDVWPLLLPPSPSPLTAPPCPLNQSSSRAQCNHSTLVNTVQDSTCTHIRGLQIFPVSLCIILCCCCLGPRGLKLICQRCTPSRQFCHLFTAGRTQTCRHAGQSSSGWDWVHVGAMRQEMCCKSELQGLYGTKQALASS